MRKILFSLVVIVVLAFPGCLPVKNISFETLLPAEISLPSDIHRMLVFNYAYYPSQDTSTFNELRNLDPNEMYVVDTIVIDNVFNGLFSALDNSAANYLHDAPYYELRPTDTIAFLKPLSRESVGFLCDSFGVDGIISFDYYAVSMDTETHASMSFDEDLNLVSVANLGMIRVMLFRIYDRKTGLLNEKWMRDTLYWSAYGDEDWEALSNLPGVSDALREAFWYGGNKFGLMISPSWDQVERAYFSLNNRQGYDIALNETRLKDIAKENRHYKAYKAAYNLALYYEMNDSIDAAVHWINQAVKIRPEAEVAKYYQTILLKRQKAVAKLREQMDH